jgi:hypothetical protein
VKYCQEPISIGRKEPHNKQAYEIWPWKLGVGEEASSSVQGYLAGVGGWVGLGWIVKARVWVGVFSSPVCFISLVVLFV